MRLLASILLLTVIAMSDTAMEAFSKISRVEISAGTMNLQEGGKVVIEATGRQFGQSVKVRCVWLNGYPVLIITEPVGGEL